MRELNLNIQFADVSDDKIQVLYPKAKEARNSIHAKSGRGNDFWVG